MSDRWIIFRHRRYNSNDMRVDQIMPPFPPWKNDIKIGDYITEYLYDSPNEWTSIPHDSIRMFSDKKEALSFLHEVVRYKGYNEIKDAPNYGVDIHPGDRYA